MCQRSSSDEASPRRQERLPQPTAETVILDGQDKGRTATTDASGRFTLAGLAQGGFSLHVTARGYSDATMGITLVANQVVEVRLVLPLARLIDIGGLPVCYERVPGGFEMFAAAVNDGPGCANSVGGGTTIKNAAPPNLTLDFSWSLPATQIIQPGEHFNYRIGVMTDEQARSFSDSTATTKFSGFSGLCP
jgi:Carboxypeptidase regulatory-like domain